MNEYEDLPHLLYFLYLLYFGTFLDFLLYNPIYSNFSYILLYFDQNLLKKFFSNNFFLFCVEIIKLMFLLMQLPY